MLRILAVDDEMHILSMLQMVFELEGYEIDTAADGEQALAKVAQKPYDLILLDVMMPGLSGFQVAEELQKDPRNSDTPIVFCSAKAEADDQWQGWRRGADSYVTKPFDTDALVEEVGRVLANRRATRNEGARAIDQVEQLINLAETHG